MPAAILEVDFKQTEEITKDRLITSPLDNVDPFD